MLLCSCMVYYTATPKLGFVLTAHRSIRHEMEIEGAPASPSNCGRVWLQRAWTTKDSALHGVSRIGALKYNSTRFFNSLLTCREQYPTVSNLENSVTRNITRLINALVGDARVGAHCICIAKLAST